MYYVCKSEGERQRHIDKIRRMVQPDLVSIINIVTQKTNLTVSARNLEQAKVS